MEAAQALINIVGGCCGLAYVLCGMVRKEPNYAMGAYGMSLIILASV